MPIGADRASRVTCTAMTRPASDGASRLRRQVAALDLRAGSDRHVDPRFRITGLLGLAGAGMAVRCRAIVFAGCVDAIALLGLEAGCRRWGRLGEQRQRQKCCEGGGGEDCGLGGWLLHLHISSYVVIDSGLAAQATHPLSLRSQPRFV